MEMLTFKEFKKSMLNTKNEIDSHFIDYLYETIGNLKLKTKNGIDMTDYLILEVKIPETKNEWIIAYNNYLLI